MEGRHSSPSHARPSSGRQSSSRETTARRERNTDITDVRNEYAERRRVRQEPERYPDENYVERRQARPEQERNADESYRRRSREPDYYDERPSGNRARKDSGKRARREETAYPSTLGEALRIILLAGVILLVFAFFQHVKDRIFLPDPVPLQPVTPMAADATPSPEPMQMPELPEAPDETDLPEEPVVEDNRTEWQKKFENKFTEETVLTDSSYTSPNISVTIETYKEEVNGHPQTWYIADIYVASIECLKTYFAKDTYIPGGCLDERVENMCSATGAIFAVSGDYCSNQKSGLLIRNGQAIHQEQLTADICVLFMDGTVETLSPDSYVPEDILARNPWQSWKFGPRLLDENGHAMTTFNSTGPVINESAPRCGFGYYEPGHYCLVVNDGRLNHSRGFLLSEFAELFEKLGCTCAYNFDGGATAVMAFNGEKYSIPYGNRNPGDIFFVAEPQTDEEEGEQ